MSLPNVFLPRQNGQLNLTIPSDDACICMVIGGVSTHLGFHIPKQIFGMAGLTALGITPLIDTLLYNEAAAFYKVAGEGVELNFMLVDAINDSLPFICDKTQATMGKKLLNFTEGRGVVFLVNTPKHSGTIANGLDQDVWDALANLNAMAVDYDNDNIPFVGILPGIGFSKDTIAGLPARATLTSDYVAINLACDAGAGVVSMGKLAGWIAKMQVNQNIARVKNGKVSDTGYFPDGTTVTALKDSLGAIHDKGYIFYRKVGQKSGYFYNDDPTATLATSDYSSISWNRVINKAKRIAAPILLEKLNDDVLLDANTGKIESTVASDWESDVETAIRNSMIKASGTKVAEISGVKCTVSADSDIVNGHIDGLLNIVRNGQAKNITMKIGYATSV